MVSTLALGLAALVASHSLADARSTSQGSGQYVLTQSRHKAKVNKIDALTLKQKQTTSSKFNPKEFTVDKPVGWNKKPKATTLCAPPGGGRPRRC
jgi:hypothetical protein